MTAIDLDKIGLLDGVPVRTLDDIVREDQARFARFNVVIPPRKAWGGSFRARVFYACNNFPGQRFTAKELGKLIGRDEFYVRAMVSYWRRKYGLKKFLLGGHQFKVVRAA